jgi:two-component system, OmpR family, sensor histidine kinase PrrB
LEGAERIEVLGDLQQEHSRLLGLLVMLRELGQGDLVEADAFGPLDLGEVVEASVADAQRRDRTAWITVSATAAASAAAVPVAVPSLTVHGWEPGLRSLLDNLIANALAHGRGDDGRAYVEVGVHPEHSPAGPIAVLTVDDYGPGIPYEQRAAVFHRFQRGRDSAGSGLGLTLVAQQAALHRATVEVRDRPTGERGTRVEVRLPLTLHEGATAEAVDPHLPAQRDWLIGTASGSQGIHKDGL